MDTHNGEKKLSMGSIVYLQTIVIILPLPPVTVRGIST